MKNKILILVAIIAVILAVTSFGRVQNISSENAILTAEKKRLQTEILSLNEQVDSLSEAKEKAEQDTLNYMKMNTDLHQEFDKLEILIEKSKEELEKQDNRIQSLQQTGDALKTRESKLSQEMKALKTKLSQVESTLAHERSIFHYNLGVAYTRAELFSDAINSYKKSLEYGNQNPEAYYNLAVLLDNAEHDTHNAINNYKTYLELVPDSEDRQYVEERVKNLIQGVIIEPEGLPDVDQKNV